jgi:hypothetical protein
MQGRETTNDELKVVVENSNKESREYLDSKVDTLKETILKATDDRVNKVVELVDAKFAKCEMALELEKAKHALEKKDWEEKIKNLEEKFKQQMADYVKKQLVEFENKLDES